MKNKILLLSLVFCFLFSSLSFAAITGAVPFNSSIWYMPSLPDYDYVEYLVYEDDNGGGNFVRFFYSNEPFNLTATIKDNYTLSVSTDKTVNTIKYFFNYQSSASVYEAERLHSGTSSYSLRTLYDNTSFSIVDSVTGDYFFGEPPATEGELYQTIQKVTEEGLAERLTLAGTIRILVLCGVGLIALLMVLNLFGRVFNPYRS